MKEFTFVIKNRGQKDDQAWQEQMGVPDGTTPLEYGKLIVEQFNAQEKEIKSPGYKPQYRELVAVLSETGKEFCDFFKVNNMTVFKGHSSYDIYKCKKCGLYHQQFGLTGRPSTTECRPKLTCTECNRVFKTEAMLARHNKINKHKEPIWLPDGV